jgi:hypothetical protein
VDSELAKYFESRGLDPDPDDIDNQGAHLLGKASDADERAPGLSRGGRFDPREGIAARQERPGTWAPASQRRAA